MTGEIAAAGPEIPSVPREIETGTGIGIGTACDRQTCGEEGRMSLFS